MPAILVVSASPSSTSKTEAVADYVQRLLAGPETHVEHLRVRLLPPQALLAVDRSDADIDAAVRAVEEADGVVLATPIYQAAYSGLLKAFLDLLPQFALAGKTVLPLATAGSLAHVLALDYGLRPVLHAMGAGHVVQSLLLLSDKLMPRSDGLDLEPTADHHLNGVVADFRAELDRPARSITIPQSA